MSESIPESIPTSKDPRSQRPLKRRALTSATQQANQVDALFANPGREINIPDAASFKPKGVPPPPEIVANVQGSSAGAGSGEFHVYKAARRREYERLKIMDEEVQQEKDMEEFERNREQKAGKEGKRMNKNKARREKAKERKGSKANGEGGAVKAKRATKIELKKLPEKDEEDKAQDDATPATNPDEIGLIIHDDD